MTFPLLAELLRTLYVDVARHDLLSDPKARTDSRICLLTGLHRKEIRKHRVLDVVEEPATVTRASEIIGRWLGSPDYRDPSGKPLPIERSGQAPSFEALVTSVTKDVRPRAVLDDWLDQGIITFDADGRLALSAEAYIPREGSEGRIFYFARNLHDHIAVATANVAASGSAPYLDRSVHYDGLSAAACAELEAVARRTSEAMLLQVNRSALAIADADDAAATDAQPRRHRVNLGVYLYVEEEPPVDER